MSVKQPFQIDIPRRASTCFHGGETLEKGKKYYSTLVDGEQEGTYERRDYCETCATQLIQSDTFKGVKSLWKSAIPPQAVKSDLPKQRDKQALQLLLEILPLQETPAKAEAFVLALYLARRRCILWRQEIKLKNGAFAQIYEVAETEQMLCVPKISLSELEVEKVQKELAKKFKNEN